MTKLKVPKTDYSKIAEYYDRVRPIPPDVLLSKIIEHGEINTNCAVLDIGCGTGRFPLDISTMKKPMICGLEPSIEMLRQAVAKDKPRNVLWLRGDGQKLPFRDSLFDCIYMTLVIHHIENKEIVLREIHRILKKGRNCLIMTASHSGIRRHVIHDFPGVTTIDLKRFPSVSFLKKAMIKIGFRDVHYHIIKHDEGHIPTDEYLERVRNKYISTLTLLSEEAFKRGFKIFQQRLRRKYGAKIRRIARFVFVVGKK